MNTNKRQYKSSVCELCKKEFSYYAPKSLKERKYCSQDCSGKINRSSHLVGVVPWNKGKKNNYSKETLEKMSKSHIGNCSESLRQHLKKLHKRMLGENHWLFGKHHSLEVRLKMSSSKLGIPKKDVKDLVTPKNRLERVRFGKQVQPKVFKRDDYTCQMCNKRGVALQVDHIKGWAEYPEFRFDMDNCRTLCMGCHYEVTFNKPMPPEIRSWGHNLSMIGG